MYETTTQNHSPHLLPFAELLLSLQIVILWRPVCSLWTFLLHVDRHQDLTNSGQDTQGLPERRYFLQRCKLLSALLLQYFSLCSKIIKRLSQNKQQAPDNSEAHRPLKKCGSWVCNTLLHTGKLRWLFRFFEEFSGAGEMSSPSYLQIYSPSCDHSSHLSQPNFIKAFDTFLPAACMLYVQLIKSPLIN